MSGTLAEQGANAAPLYKTVSRPLPFAALVPILTVGAPSAFLIEGSNGALAPLAGVTDLDVAVLVTSPGTLINLYVKSGAVGAGAKHKYTVYVNGVATAITCTTALNGGAASDTTHSVAVAAGDFVSIRVDRDTGDSLAVVGKASVGLAA